MFGPENGSVLPFPISQLSSESLKAIHGEDLLKQDTQTYEAQIKLYTPLLLTEEEIKTSVEWLLNDTVGYDDLVHGYQIAGASVYSNHIQEGEGFISQPPSKEIIHEIM